MGPASAANPQPMLVARLRTGRASLRATPGGRQRSALLDTAEAAGARCFTVVIRGYRLDMFFFFSNRLGCLGSLLVSVLATVVLLLIFVL